MTGAAAARGCAEAYLHHGAEQTAWTTPSSRSTQRRTPRRGDRGRALRDGAHPEWQGDLRSVDCREAGGGGRTPIRHVRLWRSWRAQGGGTWKPSNTCRCSSRSCSAWESLLRDLRENFFHQRPWLFGLLIVLLGVSLLKDLVRSGSLPDPMNLGFHGVFLCLAGGARPEDGTWSAADRVCRAPQHRRLHHGSLLRALTVLTNGVLLGCGRGPTGAISPRLRAALASPLR
jgi:hypothetical protein